MKKCLDDVTEFHRIGDLAIDEPPEEMDTLLGRLLDIHGRCLRSMSKNLADDFPSSPQALRARLMLEELGETLTALSAEDEAGVADGLVDLVYVSVGTAVQFGIPLDKVWAEVQKANLSKFPICQSCGGYGHHDDVKCEVCSGRGRIRTLDDSGKVTKPEGWIPPDVAKVLQEHLNEKVAESDVISEFVEDLFDEWPHLVNSLGGKYKTSG